MPKTPVPLLYPNPTALWQAILRELKPQVSQVTYDTWLASSAVLTTASTLDVLMVVVCNIYAWEWLTYRLSPFVARTAVAITGRYVTICFIPKTIRNIP